MIFEDLSECHSSFWRIENQLAQTYMHPKKNWKLNLIVNIQFSHLLIVKEDLNECHSSFWQIENQLAQTYMHHVGI